VVARGNVELIEGDSVEVCITIGSLDRLERRERRVAPFEFDLEVLTRGAAAAAQAADGIDAPVKVDHLLTARGLVKAINVLRHQAGDMASLLERGERVVRVVRPRGPQAAEAGKTARPIALPRALVKYSVERSQKAIDAHYAHYEFERRKLALKAAETHRQLRTDGCTFDEILELTTPLKRTDVIEHYCDEQELSREKRAQLLSLAAGSVPWFLALALTVSFVTQVAAAIAIPIPPIVVCDPAFVAEMPDARGTLLKIGHFDQVAGVTHVEL